MKNWTGERLETFVNNRVSIEHLHRYALAKNYIKNKIVLDIACGEGYGTNLLSENASFVYGVDIDRETVEKAKIKYTKENIQFLEGNTSAIPLNDNSVDVVISFETLEHHDKHDEMMLEITRVLKPNGVLIISTPDKLFYSDERNYKNEFHVKELYKEDFCFLISKYFKKQQLLSQVFDAGNSIIQNEKNEKELQIFHGDFTEMTSLKVKPMFLIFIASEVDFKKSGVSIFNGKSISDNYLLNQFRGSSTFKVGSIILWPFKCLKKAVKSFK